MLSVFSLMQGDALLLEYPDEQDLVSAEVQWQGKNIPLIQVEKQWSAIIGVDLETKPGEYSAIISYLYSDGSSDTRKETLQVIPKSFPVRRLTVEPRFVELNPDDLARVNRESRRLRTIFRTITPEIFWRDQFNPPIPERAGNNFGQRRVFNDQPRSPHSGADISAESGTPVMATNRGRVVVTGEFFFNGNTVILDHGLGIYSVYLHLSSIAAKEGEIVHKGQIIGLVGATGRVTGPHLHWGFRIQNARVDPFSVTRIHQ